MLICFAINDGIITSHNHGHHLHHYHHHADFFFFISIYSPIQGVNMIGALDLGGSSTQLILYNGTNPR